MLCSDPKKCTKRVRTQSGFKKAYATDSSQDRSERAVAATSHASSHASHANFWDPNSTDRQEMDFTGTVTVTDDTARNASEVVTVAASETHAIIVLATGDAYVRRLRDDAVSRVSRKTILALNMGRIRFAFAFGGRFYAACRDGTAWRYCHVHLSGNPVSVVLSPATIDDTVKKYVETASAVFTVHGALHIVMTDKYVTVKATTDLGHVDDADVVLHPPHKRHHLQKHAVECVFAWDGHLYLLDKSNFVQPAQFINSVPVAKQATHRIPAWQFFPFIRVRELVPDFEELASPSQYPVLNFFAPSVTATEFDHLELETEHEDLGILFFIWKTDEVAPTFHHAPAQVETATTNANTDIVSLADAVREDDTVAYLAMWYRYDIFENVSDDHLPATTSVSR